MKMLVGAVALVAATPATAEVVNSGENGFELRYSLTVPTEPAAAMNAFADVARWWDQDHTYSGSASNLTLEPVPGGCFCERFGDGGIEHLRVTHVQPSKRLVMTGSLGPLLFEATTGVMDVQVKPVAGGSEVMLNYKVAGFANGGADKLAPLVDSVLDNQVNRYRAFVSAQSNR